MNSEEVAGTISYLSRCWGGDLTSTQREAFARLFARNCVEDVIEAIEDFLDRNAYRPSPAELAARLRAIRLDAIRNGPRVEVDADKLREHYGKPAEPWPPPGTTPAYASEPFKAARALVP